MKSRITPNGVEILREGTPKAKYRIESGNTPRERLEAELKRIEGLPREANARRYQDLSERDSDLDLAEFSVPELIQKYRELLA